jgi:sarcosine oxidase
VSPGGSWFRHYFPDANNPTTAPASCFFTNTVDGHFNIDRLPSHAEVVIAGGFSGHGFKFCSVVGEIVADMVLAAPTPDIELFALDRFAG